MICKITCSECGSSSAPKGARFCPHCGTSLTSDFDVNSNVDTNTMDTPLASAVPLSEVSSADDFLDTTPTTSYPMTNGSMYFKNPTPTMLKRYRKHRVVAGVLFVNISDQYDKIIAPKSITVATVLTGNKIDLSVADFVHPVTKIQVPVNILGGLHVIVPRGVAVETRGIGILGSFTGVKSQGIHSGQDRPLVIVEGMTVLGGVHVSINKSVPPVKIIY